MSKKESNPQPPRPQIIQNGVNRGANVNPPPPTNAKPSPPPPPPKRRS